MTYVHVCDLHVFHEFLYDHDPYLIQVHKTKFKNKRSLKVYSITQNMEKNLPEECRGNFSTQPYHNRILLGDLVEHSPKPFPCAAVIYLNAEMYTNPRTSTYVSYLSCACELLMACSE